MLAIPFATCSALMSRKITGRPRELSHCAMPAPITPAPMTAARPIGFAASELHQPLARHEFVHHAVVQRLSGGQCFAAQDDVQSAGQTDEARQTRAAAPRRQNAELGFRQSNSGGPLRRSEAGVARQTNFVAAS